MQPGNRDDHQFEEEPRYAVRLPFVIQLVILPICFVFGLGLLWTAAWFWGVLLLAFCGFSVLRAIRGIFSARRC